MTEQTNKNASFKVLVPLSLVLAIGALLAGVYVMNGGDGNQSIDALDANMLQTIQARAVSLETDAQGDVAPMAALDEPKLFPGDQFIGPDGSTRSIADFKGKVLLVNIWATWCAPCREEMPALSELQAQRKSDQFEVLTINIDRGDREKPSGFLEEIGVENLALYQDNSMGLFQSLKKKGVAFGLPVTMLLDENGYMLASMNGPAHWSSLDALSYIDAAIASKP